jgi:hypothetical protein
VSDVVVPSLPGYGFSDRPPDRFASNRTPDLWAKLMGALGYGRYGARQSKPVDQYAQSSRR